MNILIKPVITEKMTEASEKNNRFGFVVDRRANKLEIKDVLRTFIEHVAFQIAEVVQNDSKILITGGGAFNDFLVQRIEHYLQQKVELPVNEIIDYKEALIFAFLGMLRIEGQVNCLKSVTGASKDHSSGKIFTPLK